MLGSKRRTGRRAHGTSNDDGAHALAQTARRRTRVPAEWSHCVSRRFPGNCRPQSDISAVILSRKPMLAGHQAGAASSRAENMPSTEAAPAILAESASKLFLDGAVVAFHQLSLAVRRNEIMCVVGPSGCGKTTLVRCIAGLTDLSSGRLLVQGEPVAGRPPDGVAMVFQHFGLLPWKTVFDNAAFGLAMAGVSRAEIKTRVEHYLERALAMNPSILLMDEPFAALDAQTREILQEELLLLMERPDERKTMVFITHSIDEAILLGDRIAVMSARPGRIKEVLDMPFGWPRNADAVRSDPRFTEFRLHIWHQLHTAKPASLRAPREV